MATIDPPRAIRVKTSTGWADLVVRGPAGADSTVPGPPGATGSQGPAGATGSQGIQGVPGTPGEVWFTGSGAPAGSLPGSIVNDWYLNSANGDYYEKTGASAWTLRGNLRGPQGIQGIQGPAGSGGGLPADVVVAAAAFLIRNKLLAGDAQPAFVLSGNGGLNWGPGGATAPDTWLARGSALALSTNAHLSAAGFSPSGEVYNQNGKWFIGASGELQWGPGDWSRDTTLQRVAANHLRASGILEVQGYMVANGGAAGQIWLHPDGGIYFSNLADTVLKRIGPGWLRTDGDFEVYGNLKGGGRVGEQAKSIADWNMAITNGWYMGAGVLNQPVADGSWYIGEVTAHNDLYVTQRAWNFTGGTAGPLWERRSYGGTWGPWVAVNLFRVDATTQRLNDTLLVGGELKANYGQASQIILGATGTGQIYFGAANDTAIRRVAAGWLAVDTCLQVADQIQAAWDGARMCHIANTAGLFLYGANPKITFGLDSPGDTTLRRVAADRLKTDGIFDVGKDLSVDQANAGHRIYFGPGDVTLMRSAAGVLQLDGQLNALGAVTTKTKAGAPTDADTALDQDGTLIVDTTNHRLYGRSGGAWKYAQLNGGGGGGAAPGYGIALPASPIDGQEYILVDSLTAPTYAWRFRYSSSITDAYKWVCVGGSPVDLRKDGATSRASASYGDAADGTDPKFTLPRAGIYDIGFGSQLHGAGSTGLTVALLAVVVGATAASDNDAAIMGESSGTNVTLNATTSRTVRKTGAASDVVKLAFRGDGANSLAIERRFLTVQPFRVS